METAVVHSVELVEKAAHIRVSSYLPPSSVPPSTTHTIVGSLLPRSAPVDVSSLPPQCPTPRLVESELGFATNERRSFSDDDSSPSLQFVSSIPGVEPSELSFTVLQQAHDNSEQQAGGSSFKQMVSHVTSQFGGARKIMIARRRSSKRSSSSLPSGKEAQRTASSGAAGKG